MNYLKSLCFYFLEVVGALCNLLCSVFGAYPSLDLGVSFLVYSEGFRIRKEQTTRQTLRATKEVEANSLKSKAKENGKKL